MLEGYCADGDCSCAWLDELFCEYVDGTMDPVVREVFEEYLADNPAMAAHAEQLRTARALLGSFGCRAQLAYGVQARVRRRIAHEILQSQPSLPLAPTLTFRTVAGLASATVLLLLAGMFAGTLISAELDETVAEVQTETATEQPVSRHAAMTPLASEAPRHARLDRASLFIQPTVLHTVPEVLPVSASLVSPHPRHAAP